MTTIGIPREQGATTAAPVRVASRVQDNLLVCGILAALVYIVTDVLGVLRYPGYDVTAQGISELMAVGAPTKHLVDSIFVVYGVLAFMFAIGVLRESSGQRALRVTGLALLGYAAAGALGRIFPAYARGAGGFGDNVPHVVLTGVLVVLMLAALGFASLALGKRFRIYSLATLGVIVALGIASGVYATRMAAQQPTPGFGIVERVLIYAYLIWAAILGGLLMRRHSDAIGGNPA
jgi:hypothetical membrane protein